MRKILYVLRKYMFERITNHLYGPLYLKEVFQNYIFFIEKVLLVMPSNRNVKVKVNTILYFLNTFPNRGKIHSDLSQIMMLG